MSRLRMPTALFLPVMLLWAVLAVASDGLTVKPGCQSSCGGVDIPYPFGIGDDCFRPGFEVGCYSNTPYLPGNTTGSVPSSTGIQVLSLSVMPRPEARVMLPVAFQCFNTTGHTTGFSYGTVDFNRAGVYRISDTHNELFVLGCQTQIYINSGPPGRNQYSYYTGCVAYCNDSRSAQDGACSGIGCCHVDIPPGLTDNWMYLATGTEGYAWSHVDMGFSPCDYAFIVEKGDYVFKVDDLTKMPTTQTMPLRLDWAIRDSNINSTGSMYSCAQVVNRTGYTCVSDHTECIDSTNGPGYFCNCTNGYEGNPYLPQGCKNINECARREEFPCNGECQDTEGSYNCICRRGYQSDGDPKESPCNPKFSRTAKLALGLTFGVSFMIVAVLTALIKLERRKRRKLFDNNGGKALEDVTGLVIFTKEALKKITNNYSTLLGNGAYGNVYKGTLPENTVVAVKESNKVDKGTKEAFTEEVKIQIKMIHKNILKLIGCCLEVDVPKLVYEFAAKGSLEDILHCEKKQDLDLDSRLEIAIGSAEGLKYMHSNEMLVIRHGDVKPGNILLDENFVPKISDFGLSKVLAPRYCNASIANGPYPYIDPVYMNTGLLTKKSDVYSFGAVLVELITREKNDNAQMRLKQLCRLYTEQKSAREMFDKDIVASEDILLLDKIGELAADCLKGHKDDRPDMKEVVKRLVVLRRSRKHGNTHDTSALKETATTNTPNGVSAPSTPDSSLP